MSDLSRPLLAALAAAGLLGVGAAQAQPGPPGTVPPPIQPDARTGQILAERAALLDKVSPVTDAMLLNPPPGEWLQWRRTYDSQGFSPLNQINKGNVASLRPAWTWSLPAGTSEVTPLVHDGVLFVAAMGERVQAFDAVKGDLLWEYVRQLPEGDRPRLKRNFAIYGDKLYVPTSDNHIVALDVKTGKVVWDAEAAAKEYDISAGPLLVKGKVIQGITTCSGIQPGGCFIQALDANTGAKLWRFNTLAHPGEPGDNTWNGLPLERRNGGAVWSTGSYDPNLGLVYFGVGNTYNWQELRKGAAPGNTRPGVTANGLYLNSTLALDPDTGQLKWYYQHLPEDMWDLDFAFERQLATLPIDGRDRRVVFTTGKMVWTDVLDAQTGKWLAYHDAGIQNIVKQVDPVTGKKTYNPEAIPDLTRVRANLQCSAGYGAKNWPANSFNPNSKILFISIAEVCGESRPRDYTSSTYNGGGQETRIARYKPGSDGNIGRLDAVDMKTMKTVWSTRQRASVTSAVLSTAGGVVFAGDADRWFKAYDDATGKVLWQMRLNDAVNAFPITYAVNGKQYVAVVAGFGGPRIGNLRQLTTEIQNPRGGGSAALWVFELPTPAGR
jgi:alcohol dehydrogenase (cytochrome c)